MCYAYLSDVLYINEIQVDTVSLAKSKWFTRGWTLQELIAPRTVVFYSQCWHEIGTKSSLRSVITSTSRIHDRALSGIALENFSIAQKMSWASKRQTTRVEDLAYSLMGIFDVNMPMLYGEGSRAFFRLQEEIIKRTNDHSIFAWQMPKLPNQFGGLLAYSPAAFHGSYNIIRTERSTFLNTEASTNSGDFSITNKGILLRSPLQMVNRVLTVALDCTFRDHPTSMIFLRLYSRRQDTWRNANLYDNGLVRKADDPLHHVPSKKVAAEYQIRPLHIQTEFVHAGPTELLRTTPSACLVQSSRFESFMQSAVTAETAEGLYFQPQINQVTKFHFLNDNIGSFVVKVGLSFVWKKLRVEVSEYYHSLASAQDLEEHGLVSTERTWYSHPNPEDLATEPPDRIIWSFPRRTHLLLVAIRNKFISGVKVQEIELDIYERISSSQPGSPILVQPFKSKSMIQAENSGDPPKSEGKHAHHEIDPTRGDDIE